MRGSTLLERVYYSVGGGFVVDTSEPDKPAAGPRFPTRSRPALSSLRLCKENGLSLSTLVLENEKALRPEAEVRAGVMQLVTTMRDCVRAAASAKGILPGGLKVKRRAASLLRKLRADASRAIR